jgi:hypothetical protein
VDASTFSLAVVMRDERQNGQAVGAGGCSTSGCGAFPQFLVPSVNIVDSQLSRFAR